MKEMEIFDRITGQSLHKFFYVYNTQREKGKNYEKYNQRSRFFY